jgi:hypothetical protein
MQMDMSCITVPSRTHPAPQILTQYERSDPAPYETHSDLRVQQACNQIPHLTIYIPVQQPMLSGHKSYRTNPDLRLQQAFFKGPHLPRTRK